MENLIPYIPSDSLSAADVFGAASELALRGGTAHAAATGAGDAVLQIAALAVTLFDVVTYLLVSYRVEVFERTVFELVLHSLHTESVCERGVNVHRFKGGASSFFVLLYAESTHIVKTVAELYKDNSDILRHREEHLAEILNVLLLLIGKGNTDELSQTVYEVCYILAERLFYHRKVDKLAAVLDCVVEKRGADGIGIKTKTYRYFGNRDGMAYIGIAAVTVLTVMKLARKLVRLHYLFGVVVLARFFNGR